MNFSNVVKESSSKIKPKSLIIDFSCVPFVDITGVQTIKEVISLMKENDIHVYLTSCSRQIIQMFIKTKFFDFYSSKFISETNHDAVVSAIKYLNLKVFSK